jgi:hypothetical protein
VRDVESKGIAWKDNWEKVNEEEMRQVGGDEMKDCKALLYAASGQLLLIVSLEETIAVKVNG